MNRRRFLLSLTTLCALLPGGGVPVLARHSRFHCGRIVSYSDLPADLRALYSPDFVRAFPGLTLDGLIEALCARHVLARGKIDAARVRDNAADDPLVEFDGFFWTESELMLYALVARLRGKQEGRRGRRKPLTPKAVRILPPRPRSPICGPRVRLAIMTTSEGDACRSASTT